MITDPFAIKKYPKWHPLRVAFTVKARLLDREARLNFNKYKLPEILLPNLPSSPELDDLSTAVTSLQMQHLLSALSATEHLKNTVVVEVGSYRGVTTQVLAKATSRKVIAVDPYIGYGGSDRDYHCFQKNTLGLSNVIHERMTSGEAVKTWQHGPVSLVFIDALHNYVNTYFDIKAWSSLTIENGILAMHDTDQYCFAGTRKAVFKTCKAAELFAHPDNLTLVHAQKVS
ncbi:class I SAM-dependent methyltransferase [Oscillatoriales cyanobacterium LEGE 11467]|uniref:Class I SAM-dependent methyltransferase n=1 Tax=Zarconia navalis LEGE 11467 TaxID=1828826 RepID=A0A928Z6T3_9CYAN|nr:class I SAM-dependent methyltransferase [Zarconia navalis]MBE9039850.1 class I SAM-dependent methyltransferase [Zarconia navalis LEGE 11467]